MAKITIEIDSETHQKLKEYAAKDERSLAQYTQRVLRQHVGTLTTSNTATSSNDNNSYDNNHHNNSYDNNYTSTSRLRRQIID